MHMFVFLCKKIGNIKLWQVDKGYVMLLSINVYKKKWSNSRMNSQTTGYKMRQV